MASWISMICLSCYHWGYDLGRFITWMMGLQSYISTLVRQVTSQQALSSQRSFTPKILFPFFFSFFLNQLLKVRHIRALIFTIHMSHEVWLLFGIIIATVQKYILSDKIVGNIAISVFKDTELLHNASSC